MFTIEKKHKNANIRTTIRFTEPLYEKLTEYKEKHGISFNELVLKCCEYALDNYGKEK
jgi:predicted CopG family antitoxin